MAQKRGSRVSTAIVIPTTHWDRAWYWPFERFRVKLVELFATVKSMWKSHPSYRFSIDGQCVPVEDYLEVVPSDENLLQQMGRRGRFTMGPLYVQSDLYCTGGESFIRNMLIGKESAERFNALQRPVYMPDTFGHIPEIPMLVRGFGYDTYVFMRGTPSSFPQNERFFRWKSADGSVVNVFRLRDGYANAARLGLHSGTGEIFDKKSSGIRPGFRMELAVEQLEKAAARQLDGQGAPHVLIAGVDHQIPQKELPDIMQRCSTPGIRLEMGDWNDVERELAQRNWNGAVTYEGEFHGDGAATVLGGTVAARIYLKQSNAAVERLLGHVAEAADAVLLLLGIDDPAGHVTRAAWKRLLKAHPHDDITGCSVDLVHRETEGHIIAAAQAADGVRRRIAERLVGYFGGQIAGDERYAFFVMDMQGRSRRARVRVKADFEGRYNWGDTKPPESYRIVDDAGREVPYRERSRARSLEHPHPVLELELAPNLPASSFQRFYFQPSSRTPYTAVKSSTIENERLRVSLRTNGSVDIYDKRTRRTWKGIGLFSDQADCGDEYTFSHIKSDTEKVFDDVRAKQIPGRGCSGLQVLACKSVLKVPAQSNPGGRSRKMQRVPVEIEYSLAPDETALTCRMRFTNTACDHRFRWNLMLPRVPQETRAGLKFSEVRRAAGRRICTANGFEIDPEHPTDHFVAAELGSAGIAVFSQFPVNYELCRSLSPRLAVTVVRAIGMLSRNDMLTRAGGAGPDTLTPDAQCLRDFDMTFAVRPYDVPTEGAVLFAESALWRSEPVTGLIFGCDPAPAGVDESPLFEVSAPQVIVSAFKRHHDGAGALLRLFNAYPQQRDVAVKMRQDVTLRALGLDEQARSDSRIRKSGPRTWSVTMAPYSLCTLGIEYRACS